MKSIKIKMLENGPIRLSVDSDEEIINNVLFDIRGNSIKIKKNSILCRCGKSNQQPFCDGVHRMIGFSCSAGEEDTFEGVKVSVMKRSSLDIEKADNTKYRLCRCGASQKQPYCDDTHKTITSKKYTF
ncbi:CDGSH iron-sulfur domain-containing protein [Sulfurospirillum arcachonense]|uniref:CDGSH iron-sulfur domain-containing protein n=1 Tax=Sulfurospirillum arcachonense TaxID=57666 RepID=UPI00046A7281|nr:CDGSH iron-sulfur domain-containing protein [Sulfurospirillum arcachonense]